MSAVFALLIVYQWKHFIADYPLQGKYMLGKFRPGWNFVGPLAAHCGVHALLTLVIASCFFQVYGIECYGSLPLELAILDFCVHFAMDRIKAGPKYLGRFKDMMKPYFWWSLGFDQMIHHLTHYYIVWKLISFAANAPIAVPIF